MLTAQRPRRPRPPGVRGRRARAHDRRGRRALRHGAAGRRRSSSLGAGARRRPPRSTLLRERGHRLILSEGGPHALRLAARRAARRRALPHGLAAPRRPRSTATRASRSSKAPTCSPGGPLAAPAARRPPRRRATSSCATSSTRPRYADAGIASRRIRPAASATAERDVADEPQSSQTLMNAALAGLARRADRLVRAARHRLRRARLPARTSTSSTASRSGRTTGTRAATRFVGYSLLYYPLAALVGIRLLAVLSVAAVDSRVHARRASGPGATRRSGRRGSSRSSPPPRVVSAAFPYGLGLAFALTALVALARAPARGSSRCSPRSTFAASPLAFLLPARRARRRRRLAFAAARSRRRRVASPRSAPSRLAALAPLPRPAASSRSRRPSCSRRSSSAALGAGAHLARRARAHPARALHRLRRSPASLAYLDPVHARRERRAPALRRGADRGPDALAPPLAAAARSALARSRSRSRGTSRRSSTASSRTSNDPSARRALLARPWSASSTARSRPSYRVEAVGTADHWEAVYLPQAGIPIVRGWFRQDDFPQNEVLYDKLSRSAYLAWLHRLSVRYVVLTDAPPDYSARGRRRCSAAAAPGCRSCSARPTRRSTRSPSPVPIVTGPGRPRVLAFRESSLVAGPPSRRHLPRSPCTTRRTSPRRRRACASRPTGWCCSRAGRRREAQARASRSTATHALAALSGSRSMLPARARGRAACPSGRERRDGAAPTAQSSFASDGPTSAVTGADAGRGRGPRRDDASGSRPRSRSEPELGCVPWATEISHG